MTTTPPEAMEPVTAAPDSSGRLLVVVDVQDDFCEGGALAVSGGKDVAGRIAEHVRARAADGSVAAVAFSRDHHRPDDDNGGHFAAEPDFVDTWPVHCVAGTDGARLRPEIAALLEELRADAAVPVHEVRKGYGEPAYSALEGVLGDPGTDAPVEPFAQAVEREGWGSADVVGLALDHCVAATARDLARLGVRTRILEDLTAAVSPQDVPRLREDLGARGIEMIGGDR